MSVAGAVRLKWGFGVEGRDGELSPLFACGGEKGRAAAPWMEICVLYPGVYWERVLLTPELLWALCLAVPG